MSPDKQSGYEWLTDAEKELLRREAKEADEVAKKAYRDDPRLIQFRKVHVQKTLPD